MNKAFMVPTLSLVVIIATMVLTSCTEDGKSKRGLKYMPDMFQSPALKSQESFVIERHDEDGKHYKVEVPAMNVMPEGTVPRHFIPYDISDSEQGNGLTNPLAPNSEMLRLGRDKYLQFCSVCHGKEGDAAQGYIADTFLGIPSLNTSTVESYKDGHIFWIISAGRGRMANYRAQLSSQERWAVILYVRSLFAATNADASLKELLKKENADFKPLRDPISEYDLPSWPPEKTK